MARNKQLRKLLTRVVVVIVAFLILGSFIYLLNTTRSTNLTGGKIPTTLFSNDYRVPPNELGDVYALRPDGRGGHVRVMMMVLGTSMSDPLCMFIASAYMVGLPVVVIGVGEHYEHVRKVEFGLHTVEKAALDPQDVVFMFDADILFTGASPWPPIDEFIARSPASLDELDPLAVRERRMAPPLMMSLEHWCYAVETIGTFKPCNLLFDKVDAEITAYATKYNYSGLYDRPSNYTYLEWNPIRYINGGMMVARVWAYREVAKALQDYMRTEKRNEWFFEFTCDQSILYHLYTDLRLWEISTDILSFPLTAAKKRRSRFGLHAGVFGLDERGLFVGGHLVSQHHFFELTDERWVVGNEPRTPMKSIVNRTDVGSFVESIYARNPVLYRMAVPRSRVPNITHVDVTPPLYAIVQRPVDIINGTLKRVFPIGLHVAGPPLKRTPGASRADEKRMMLEATLSFLAWYIPMEYSLTSSQKSEEYLRSMPLELWSFNGRRQVVFGDQCTFPFNRKRISKA